MTSSTSSSSSSLCRRHTDLHSPVTGSYAPSSLSAFFQSSTSSTDLRRHNYQCTTDYLPPHPRVTSASTGLHDNAMTQHVHQQQQQLQRSPSFAIHELLGLHGPMLPAACHGGAPSLMFDCVAGGCNSTYGGAAGAGPYVAAAAMTGSGYRQQAQFFPTTYHSSGAPAPPSTPLSMPDLDAPPQPAPAPLLPPGPSSSCHRSSPSSWPPSTSPTPHIPELMTAHAHRPTIYRDAYNVLQRSFKPDVARAFGAARSVSHKCITQHRMY